MQNKNTETGSYKAVHQIAVLAAGRQKDVQKFNRATSA